MTSFDEAIRDALRPLAGDPGADARAVLSRLPRPRRFHWRDVAVIAAAAAAGVLVGVLVAKRAAPRPDPVAKDQLVQTPPAAPAPALVRLAIGRVITRDEAGGSRERVLQTLGSVDQGAWIETAEDGKAELLLADGSVVRLDSRTAIALGDQRELRLERGQFWAKFSSGPRRIRHEQAVVECDDAAVVDVMSYGDDLAVTALEGTARLITPGENQRRVRPMQRVAVRDGILRDRETIYWAFEVTHWQLDLLCGSRVPEEVAAMAAPAIEMLAHPEMHSFGEMDLRAMGECAMAPLFAFLKKTDPVRDVFARMRAATVLADSATFRGIDGLFAFLADECPGVRGQMHLAIARVSGMEWRDAHFWSMAPAAVREQEARAWREQLKR